MIPKALGDQLDIPTASKLPRYTDDLVMAGPDHRLRFGGDADNPDPRLHVRGAAGNGLEARIDRALYYAIVDMALADGDDPPAIWSGGARFPLVDT